jgi:hypothetical protein
MEILKVFRATGVISEKLKKQRFYQLMTTNHYEVSILPISWKVRVENFRAAPESFKIVLFSHYRSHELS